MKAKLLVLELWGLGDLAIGTPFLQAAPEHYDVTLVAKPYAQELQLRLWPGVRVIPFNAPWTAFKGKYQLHRWPWGELAALKRQLQAEEFEVAFSARHDLRDHALLHLSGATRRLGFPHLVSAMFLTDGLTHPGTQAHRYDQWRVGAQALQIDLPERAKLTFARARAGNVVLVHTGAAQEVRVWPLERYRELVARLRAGGYTVQVVCDTTQIAWWKQAGERGAEALRTLAELFQWIEQATAFIGNDSGPGNLAAISGVPTFTIFGPQLPQWFAPLHPASQWIEGAPCPYKPCFDSCHYAEPHCLRKVELGTVWAAVEKFVHAHTAQKDSAVSG